MRKGTVEAASAGAMLVALGIGCAWWGVIIVLAVLAIRWLWLNT